MKQRTLIVTSTGELFVPTRLTFRIDSCARARRSLRAMQCMKPVGKDRFEWQLAGEAEELGVPIPSGIPAGQALILGHVSLHKKRGSETMRLECRSTKRILLGAHFFTKHIPNSVPVNARVINRLFAHSEGSPEALLERLDQNVTVIDVEANIRRSEERWDAANIRTMADAERHAARDIEERIASRKDVPEVEDFPLAPEEETPDFYHLRTTFMLREMRAMRRWNGEDVTLPEIILELTNQMEP